MALNGYPDYFAQKLQDYIFSNNPAVSLRPANMYCGLSTNSTPIDPPLTNWTEPIIPDPGYVRQDVTQGVDMWDMAQQTATAPSKWTTTNNDDIVWQPAGGSGWGTVYAACIFESSTVGDTTTGIVGGMLSQSKTIASGTSPLFLTDAFQISTSNST